MPTEHRGRTEISLQRCDGKSGCQKGSKESIQEGEGREHPGQREPFQPLRGCGSTWLIVLAGVGDAWDLELGSMLKGQEQSFAGPVTHGEAP